MGRLRHVSGNNPRCFLQSYSNISIHTQYSIIIFFLPDHIPFESGSFANIPICFLAK